MTKVDPDSGKSYGLDGEKARNYSKFGRYVKDEELGPISRWRKERENRRRRSGR